MEETRDVLTAEEAERAGDPTETGEQPQERAEPHGPEREHEEKTFTQAEVNEIVRRRLAKEREKYTSLLDGEGEQKLLEREKAVLKRELRADALDRIKEQNYPDSMADLLDYTDEESCRASFEKVTNVFKDLKKQAFEDAFRSRGNTPKVGGQLQKDSIREAFRPKI